MQRGPRPRAVPTEPAGRAGQRRASDRRPRLAAAAAAVLVAALVLAGCGGGGNSADNRLPLTGPNIVANDSVRDGGSITVALEKSVPNFNTNSSDGNSQETQMVVNGIFPTAFIQLPDFTVRMNTDLLDSAQVTKTSPQTVVYKIKPNASWS